MPVTTFTNPKNNVASVLANSIGSTDTTISLTPGSGAQFPPAPFYCSCEFEVMRCGSITGDVLTVTRGQDGTTAISHLSGTIVEIRNNAALFTDAYGAINGNAAIVDNLTANILNKSALPPDTTFAGNTQELTHKTIDLSDASKQNVIIGTVQPDPASLPLQNILINGGFEEWTFQQSTTLPAGTPTSGSRGTWFCNGWSIQSANDSAGTAAKDTANSDPVSPSGTNLLLNISTVQANDYVFITQALDSSNSFFNLSVLTDLSDIKKLVGAPLSLSARIKLISGSNITVKLQANWYDGSYHSVIGPAVPVNSSSYSTFKFENQIMVPNQATVGFAVYLYFQGVGQVAIDNVMLNVGQTAVGYRARPAIKPPNQNLLVNGDFETWQRGTGFSAQGYCADGWAFYLSAPDTMSVYKVASDTGYSTNGNVLQFDYVHNTSGFSTLQQRIATSELSLRNQIVTFSVWLYTSTPNAARAFINTDGTGGGTSTSQFHPGNSTYQKLSVSFLIPPDATFVTVGINPQASCTVFIDHAALVIGAIPADYVPMHPADNMARCLRYYEARIYGGSEIMGFAMGAGIPSFYSPYHKWTVRKAVTPSITMTGGAPYLYAPAIFGPGITSPSLSASIDEWSCGGSCSGIANASMYGQLGNTSVGTGIIGEANP